MSSEKSCVGPCKLDESSTHLTPEHYLPVQLTEAQVAERSGVGSEFQGQNQGRINHSSGGPIPT